MTAGCAAEVEREGQQPARGLVAGDQEGDHLIADVLVGEAFAGLRIAPVEHQVQQVAARGGIGIALALRDQRVGDVAMSATSAS
jgi:hypothetical protein